jgi:hypothetical protein
MEKIDDRRRKEKRESLKRKEREREREREVRLFLRYVNYVNYVRRSIMMTSLLFFSCHTDGNATLIIINSASVIT